MTLPRRRVRDAGGRPSGPGAERGARPRTALACAAFLLVVLLAETAHATGGEEGPDTTALRAALDRAFVAAERDHAKVRAEAFAGSLGAFPARLAPLLTEARRKAAGDDADRETRVAAEVARAVEGLRADGPLPVSETTLQVILRRLLPRDARVDDPLTDARAGEEFVAAARDVFAAERFEDCWDASFQDLPEVRAWRAAHAPKPAEGAGPGAPSGSEGTPGGPGGAPRDGEGAGERRDVASGEPAAPEAGSVGAAPGLPSPFAPEPTANLVLLDRARRWVGPWTGWVQEIPERENRRQSRPGKTVWMDRYEVTCRDYLTFLQGVDPARRRALLPVGWSLDDRLTPSYPEGRERTAVTGVTYAQAQEYAASVGKRLPTEDEWDRAAAGGEKEARAYPWGDDADVQRCAFGGTGVTGPEAVDAHQADRTPEGIVGLAGNVAEMVATQPDRRDPPARLAPTDPIVVRGGSWRTTREADCGTTFRWILESGQSASHVGFRCVMDEWEYRRRFR